MHATVFFQIQLDKGKTFKLFEKLLNCSNSFLPNTAIKETWKAIGLHFVIENKQTKGFPPYCLSQNNSKLSWAQFCVSKNSILRNNYWLFGVKAWDFCFVLTTSTSMNLASKAKHTALCNFRVFSSMRLFIENSKLILRASFCVLRRKSWELSHVIFLKMRKK